MRTAVLGLAVEHDFLRPLINPRQTEAVCYADSSLNGSSVGEFSAGPVPGSVALRSAPLHDIRVRRSILEGHVTDLLAGRASRHLLLYAKCSCVVNEFGHLGDALRASAVPFRLITLAHECPANRLAYCAWDHTRRLFAMYGAAPGTMYLLRPDGHVLARWQQASAENVRSAIARALHAPLPHSNESAL